MVHLTCDCLNVRVHTKGSSAVGVDVSTLNLTNEQLSDPFLRDGRVCAVTLDIGGITKEVPCLVKSRSLGEWVVYSCVNCKKDAYALLSNRGLDHVLVSQKLKSDTTELSALMQSEAYSPLYKIIVPRKMEPKMKKKTSLELHTRRSDALETTLSSLQQQLTRFLQSEQEALEERIRNYVEQQRSVYAALQNRVRQDKKAIASLLLESEELDLQNSLSEAMIETQGLTPPMTPVSNTNQISNSPVINSGGFREQLNSEEQDQVVSEIPKHPLVRQRPQSFNRPLHGKLRRKGVYNPPRIAHSLDIDGIFDLDGVEEELSPFYHSEDEADAAAITTDGCDEVFIPLGGRSPMRMATDERQKRAVEIVRGGQMSLPINMPVWTRGNHAEPDSDDEETVQIPDDPAQIAESIKAMARSIHQSDTTEMFGDLPRPRLNTLN